MSDDTPTERFPASEAAGTEPLPSAGGDSEPLASADGATEPLGVPKDAPAPTEVLFTPRAASASPPPGSAPPKQSRAMLYTLIAVGAALLFAVIVVALLLLNRDDRDPVATPTGSSSPSASASPSATPSAPPSEEATPEPETPVAVGPVFDSFTAQPTAGCAEGDSAKPITFSWSSSTATTAYIGVATTNAKSEPYEGGLPPVDTYTLDYQCDQASQVYTVTLEDADGNLAHQTVTISK